MRLTRRMPLWGAVARCSIGFPTRSSFSELEDRFLVVAVAHVRRHLLAPSAAVASAPRDVRRLFAPDGRDCTRSSKRRGVKKCSWRVQRQLAFARTPIRRALPRKRVRVLLLDRQRLVRGLGVAGRSRRLGLRCRCGEPAVWVRGCSSATATNAPSNVEPPDPTPEKCESVGSCGPATDPCACGTMWSSLQRGCGLHPVASAAVWEELRQMQSRPKRLTAALRTARRTLRALS